MLLKRREQGEAVRPDGSLTFRKDGESFVQEQSSSWYLRALNCKQGTVQGRGKGDWGRSASPQHLAADSLHLRHEVSSAAPSLLLSPPEH